MKLKMRISALTLLIVALHTLAALGDFGFSSICNVLAAIKTAKQLDLGPGGWRGQGSSRFWSRELAERLEDGRFVRGVP